MMLYLSLFILFEVSKAITHIRGILRSIERLIDLLTKVINEKSDEDIEALKKSNLLLKEQLLIAEVTITRLEKYNG